MRGAPGAVVDYVSVNGEPTEVIEPTPEPAVWAMMMLGFAGVAWRMKAARRKATRDKRTPYVASPSSSAKGSPARCIR